MPSLEKVDNDWYATSSVWRTMTIGLEPYKHNETTYYVACETNGEACVKMKAAIALSTNSNNDEDEQNNGPKHVCENITIFACDRNKFVNQINLQYV
jgi:hypothetical protein